MNFAVPGWSSGISYLPPQFNQLPKELSLKRVYTSGKWRTELQLSKIRACLNVLVRAVKNPSGRSFPRCISPFLVAASAAPGSVPKRFAKYLFRLAGR